MLALDPHSIHFSKTKESSLQGYSITPLLEVVKPADRPIETVTEGDINSSEIEIVEVLKRAGRRALSRLFRSREERG